MSRLWLALALLVVADGSLAQQRSLGASGTDNAGIFRGQIGRRVTYACPAGISLAASIWGTDVYTDDSPLCLAAIHAGVLQAGQAGVVTLEIGDSVPSFQASTRNGVTSQRYSNYPSMRFDTGGAPGQLDWTTTAQGIAPGIATPIVVSCPARGSTLGGIWGSDVYSEDSAICVAAVHAGVITPANGGPVAVTALPAQASFTGNTRNGITSQAYSQSHPAFRVTVPGSVSTSTGGSSGVGGLTVTVNVATATVRWDAVPGAQSYFVTRWKVGDAACCNNLSPPGVPLAATEWVDTAPLQSAGTYGYRLYATTASGVVAAETTLTWNGVESGVAQRSLSASAGAVPLATAAPAPGAIIAATEEAAPSLPANAGRYRVTLTGVQVTATTKDRFDNADGVGDEIAAVVVALHWNRTTNLVVGRDVIRGVEYGDVNAVTKAADRIQAGNAADGGGLSPRDVVPDGFAPGTSQRTPDARLFPLLVWEGVLTDGIDAVLVVPSLWERDVARTSIDKYATGWAQEDPSRTLTVAATQLPIPQLLVIQTTEHPGLPTAFAVADLAAHIVDRPLGLTLQPLVAEYHDRFIVLTREKLADLAAGSYRSLAIQYVEPASDPVLGGDYTLEMRIERFE